MKETPIIPNGIKRLNTNRGIALALYPSPLEPPITVKIVTVFLIDPQEIKKEGSMVKINTISARTRMIFFMLKISK